MTEAAVRDEVPLVAGTVPAVMVPGWLQEFGLVAGITTRGEGEPFDLGLGGDEPIGRVLERWHLLERAFDGFGGVVVGRQVHGTAVRWHREATGLGIFRDTDGHATQTPGILLAVSAADCIPVYLVDPTRRAIALLHAGWRGTAGEILRQGIRTLGEQAGSRPADLAVHCGVGICGACYPVSQEVGTACGRPPAGLGSLFLDLRSVLAEQARRQGIGRVSVSSECSAHQQERYFSHRGSGGAGGRMVAFLGYPVRNKRWESEE
ncbi:MAG: polyphenol oxidase family protein [Gemmatimonadales bacterium]